MTLILWLFLGFIALVFMIICKGKIFAIVSLRKTPLLCSAAVLAGPFSILFIFQYYLTEELENTKND